MKNLFGLIGYPLGHSFSKSISSKNLKKKELPTLFSSYSL
jgi:shikimate 5-dehydrogenase